jgi:hypothetical protein
MANLRRGYVVLTLASAAAVILSSALPADASSAKGWRLFYRHLYTPGNSAYFAVAAVSRSTAWAVGSADFAGPTGGVPAAARWHNGRWTATAMPPHLTSILWAVSADSSTDAWTVSNQGGYVLHWQKGRWTVARRWSESGGLPRELTGVTAFSPRNVWVFGGSGAFPGVGTWHEHSGVWTRVTGLGGNISFASALSPSDMWAVGGINVGQDSIMHYAGGKWHHITRPALRGLQFNAILAVSRGNVWALASKGGAPGTTRLLQLSGGRWTTRALPAGFDPTHITADGHGGLWFTALNTRTSAVWLLHRSAAGRWAIVRDPGALALALIPGTRSLWGAGAVSHKSGFEAAIYADGPVG